MKRKRIFKSIKDIILKEQNYKCIFCGCDLGGYVLKRGNLIKLKTHFDHFIPWVYSRDNLYKNLNASCNICNQIKSDMCFDDLKQAAKYILNVRHKRKIFENHKIIVTKKEYVYKKKRENYSVESCLRYGLTIYQAKELIKKAITKGVDKTTFYKFIKNISKKQKKHCFF